MATITAKSNVVFERNRFGQFATRCERAAHETVKETVERGARTSRALAPVGGERKVNYSRRPGYVPLRRSIKTFVGGNYGYWYSIAPHALFVEEGTSAHPISGKLVFRWGARLFYWNNPHFNNWDENGVTIMHPGTGAQPFLRPAYERVVRRQMMSIAKEKFPG